LTHTHNEAWVIGAFVAIHRKSASNNALPIIVVISIINFIIIISSFEWIYLDAFRHLRISHKELIGTIEIST
jgi:hypothetical protein